MLPLLPSVTEPPAPVLTLLTVSVRSDDKDSARPLDVMLLSVMPLTPFESPSENVRPPAEIAYVLVCAPVVLLWFAVSDSDANCLVLETLTLPAEAMDRLLVLVDPDTLPLVPSAFRLTLLPVIW